MKKSKYLFAATLVSMLLTACGKGSTSSQNLSTNGNTSTSVTTSYDDESYSSNSRLPINPTRSSTSKISNTSKPSSSTTSTTSTSKESSTSNGTSTTSSSTSEAPVARKILIHASNGNEGLSVTAPANAIAGDTVTLTVNLTEGYILEFIRLYAETAAAGGVRVNPDGTGKYEFVMPDKDVDIYYKGVKGYTVTFKDTAHAKAEFAVDSADYDLFGEGYPVYVKQKSVDSGYYIDSFEVKDSSGKLINVWNDAKNQVGFTMPAMNVTVTPITKSLDLSITDIAGTYSNGVAIDMNSITDAPFGLVIGLDMNVTFISDWTNKEWYGKYTYENNVLEAEVWNLTQDGYFTESKRNLKVTFIENRKYLAVEFSTTGITYHYMMGKTSEGLAAKPNGLYMSRFIGDGYTQAHRIVAFSALSGDFFTYVNPTRTEAYYYLKAFEKGSTTEVYRLVANKSYIFKDASGKAIIEADYDGNYLTVKEPAPEQEEPGGQITPDTSAPFINKRYKSSAFTLIDDDGYTSTDYTFTITFGKTLGSIVSVSFDLVDSDTWNPVVSEAYKTDGLSYTWNDVDKEISVTGLSSGVTKLTYLENGNIRYNGKIWRSDWAAYATKNRDCILKEVPYEA